MIENRKYRQKLIGKYLEAETTVQEEMLLARYFQTHKPETDETDIARLILLDYPEVEVLSDSERKRNIRQICMAISAIAACIALFAIFANPFASNPFTAVEIAENINILMEMNTQDVDSIVAVPKGSRVMLTVSMKDGNTSSFVLVRNRRDGSTRILSQNNQ